MMKNKILFSILFLIYFGVVINAQDEIKNKILSDAQAMVQYYETKNYDGFLDFSYPKLFEFQDRETLKSLIKLSIEGNGEFRVEIITDTQKQFQVSDIFKKGNTQYAFITYPTEMNMIFLEDLEESYKNMIINMMEAEGMKAKFINNKIINIHQNSFMLALNDEVTKKQWKYLNYDKNSAFSLLVSQEIIDEADLYIKSKN